LGDRESGSRIDFADYKFATKPYHLGVHDALLHVVVPAQAEVDDLNHGILLLGGEQKVFRLEISVNWPYHASELLPLLVERTSQSSYQFPSGRDSTL